MHSKAALCQKQEIMKKKLKTKSRYGSEVTVTRSGVHGVSRGRDQMSDEEFQQWIVARCHDALHRLISTQTRNCIRSGTSSPAVTFTQEWRQV